MNFLDKIINEMPENLNNLEKARYLYLRIGLIFNFSTKLNNTTENIQSNTMYLQKPNIDEIENNQLICRWWASIYSEALNKVGIENTIINMGHQFVAFFYNGKLWQADATYGGDQRNKYTDLSRIKYGDDTERFGVALIQNLSKPYTAINYNDPDMEQLEQIDKKFEFYQIRKNNFKDINNKLSILPNSTVSIKEKLEYIFKTIGTLENGYYESKDFIKNLEDNYLKEEEIKCIHAAELKRTNNNYEVDIVQCIYIKENGEYTYYLLAPTLPIQKVNKEDIIKLAILGFGLEDNKLPGINYPKKFTLGKRSTSLFKPLLIKKIPPTILDYDKEQIGKIK